MLVCKLSGGLGNQLFQYATAITVSDNDIIKFDLSYFSDKKSFNLSILDFGIKIDEADKKEIHKLSGKNTKFTNFLKRHLGKYFYPQYFKEKERTVFDESIFDPRVGYLDGYWQNEKYFLSNRDKLVKLFDLEFHNEARIFEKKIINCNSVSIHVRRGDYLKHPEIGVLDLDYYKNAIKNLEEKYNDLHFFIFSNDIDWCRVNMKFLNGKKYEFCSGLYRESDELILMSRCDHNIIANSSFSWWAAWLNQNTDKVVISPKKWMASNPNNYRWVPITWCQL